MRAEHFQAARKIVRTRLPLFVVLGGSAPPTSTLGQRTNSASNLGSTSVYDLLHLISERAEFLGKHSSSVRHAFLDELNELLATLEFSDRRLQLETSPTGVLLKIDGKPFQIATDNPQSSLGLMRIEACLAVAYSQVACKTEPIFLFEGPEHALPNVHLDELTDFVTNISKTCQCLYSHGEINIFPNDVTTKRYRAADLNMAEK